MNKLYWLETFLIYFYFSFNFYQQFCVLCLTNQFNLPFVSFQSPWILNSGVIERTRSAFVYIVAALECLISFLPYHLLDHKVIEVWTFACSDCYLSFVNCLKVSEARSLDRDMVESGLTFAGFVVINNLPPHMILL